MQALPAPTLGTPPQQHDLTNTSSYHGTGTSPADKENTPTSANIEGGKKRRRVQYVSQCDEIKHQYTKQEWDSFSAETQRKERDRFEAKTPKKDRIPRLKQGNPRRKKVLGIKNLHEGQLAIADRDLPRQPPGRPKGSTSYSVEAPKRICDVNKNFKQLSGEFYNRAAALKDRCNREEQNEPDTAIITVVVRKEQPLEGYRKSNSIFTTTQQASMPPAGGKKKCDSIIG